MSKRSLFGSVVGIAMLLWLAGCGSAQTAASPQSPHADATGYEAAYAPSSAEAQPSYEPAGEAEALPAAPSSMSSRSSSVDGASMIQRPSPQERPGLGTAWGETRHSPTTSTRFVRDTAAPFAVASLWYNDRQGANAMARSTDYRSYQQGAVPVLSGAITISLRDDAGRRLDGFYAGGKDYVVGEDGMRYVIVIQNNTRFRYECVASVDGLDVIDGRTAAYTKRGYLLQPHGVLEIDGFRRSADAVAAFRFSSVRSSYASKSGKGDRNVGVIGIAFFNEEGAQPTWSDEEIQRRHDADPFPGRYAEPPQ
ncbi:MAG TPA: hypothetical protein PLJ27_06460 [Polyangiaceae bacterium]|nr:MAG: hypothetical protein BWY17_04520 [Deltaproteobacteria bacterium ADurb.Bin207]HOT10346.1 hypothetical protein [Polyangiaceae bacterium]HPB95073.1 hypothetical protein [Polyangiaceae bacterium]HQB42682.1 hypothetical protein [Polyangiaceae bacterium]HQF24258.1 hypothetical protein [Polyangiaceae bacterium]